MERGTAICIYDGLQHVQLTLTGVQLTLMGVQLTLMGAQLTLTGAQQTLICAQTGSSTATGVRKNEPSRRPVAG
jgi:hypothetical protein